MLVVAEQRLETPAATVCWMIGQRNASRASRQHSLICARISPIAASACGVVGGGIDAAHQVIGIEREQHGVRLEFVQRRLPDPTVPAGIGRNRIRRS